MITPTTKFCDKCCVEHQPQFCRSRPHPKNIDKDCKHRNYVVQTGYFVTEQEKDKILLIQIACEDCGWPYEFIGIKEDTKVSFVEPSINHDGTKLFLPTKLSKLNQIQ